MTMILPIQIVSPSQLLIYEFAILNWFCMRSFLLYNGFLCSTSSSPYLEDIHKGVWWSWLNWVDLNSNPSYYSPRMESLSCFAMFQRNGATINSHSQFKIRTNSLTFPHVRQSGHTNLYITWKFIVGIWILQWVKNRLHLRLINVGYYYTCGSWTCSFALYRYRICKPENFLFWNRWTHFEKSSPWRCYFSWFLQSGANSMDGESIILCPLVQPWFYLLSLCELYTVQLLSVPIRKLHTSECQKKIERFTKDLRSQLSYSVLTASSHQEKIR